MEFNALRKHGHYPSTVVFAFAILGSLKMKVLLTVETLVDKYNQLIEWIGYFPVAARSSNFAEEIQRKLPIEITIKTEEGEIKMTTKEDPEWIISSKLIGNYLILSADKPEQKKKIERTKKRPQENETSLEKTKEKKPTMGRKLSLFDQMKYSANSSQELNSAEVSSTEMKTVPASSRIAHKSIQSAKISHPRTWESWFEENAIPESKPQNFNLFHIFIMRHFRVRISTVSRAATTIESADITIAYKSKPRRHILATFISGSFLHISAAKAELPCRGFRGYELRQCLREKRAQQNESQSESTRDEYLKLRQFEQPGDLVTLPNGFHEMETGTSNTVVTKGAICSVSYIVYRLSSGAYFKYSSGGTPVYLFSLGYGFEGKDDVDGVYQFRFGDKGSLPLAVSGSIEGMREGSRRRILVPPRLGWTDAGVNPRPDTFGGTRRLASHKNEPLLFEIEIKRIQTPSLENQSEIDDESMNSVMDNAYFSLPGPPPSFQK
eukprot:g1046.t1